MGSPYIKYGDLDPTFPTLRYGIGNWLEHVDAATGEVTENSSQGAFGCSPWIDRRRNLAGILLVSSTGEDVQPFKVDPDVTVAWPTSDGSGAVVYDVLFAPDGADFSTAIVEGLSGDARSFIWTVPADVPKTKRSVVKVVARNSAGRPGESVSGTLVVK